MKWWIAALAGFCGSFFTLAHGQGLKPTDDDIEYKDGQFVFEEPFVVRPMAYEKTARLERVIPAQSSLVEAIPAGSVWFQRTVALRGGDEKLAWCVPAKVVISAFGRIGRHAICAFDIKRNSATYGVAGQRADYFPSFIRPIGIFEGPAPQLTEVDGLPMPDLALVLTIAREQEDQITTEAWFLGADEHVYLTGDTQPIGRDGYAEFDSIIGRSDGVKYRARYLGRGGDFEVVFDSRGN